MNRKYSRPVKLAAVFSHPIQHFAPMFRELAQVPGIELKVFYCCDWGSEAYLDPGFGESFAWDVPLLEGYDYEFLPIRERPTDLTFLALDNPEVGSRLSAFSPDAVLMHGYSHRTQWRVWLWARGRAKRLFFGDSELLHRRSLRSRMAKRFILPPFFRGIDAFITIGDNNEAYYRHYGVAEKKMFRGAYPVDISRFAKVREAMTPSMRREVRDSYGLRDNSMVALFLGKFIPIKRPMDLVEAMGMLRGRDANVQALLVGSGELQGDLEQRIAELGLGEEVRFSGFVNQKDLPAVLCSGDVLAMCSEKDPHPLAVTESMACGNAVVASDRVGCVGPTDAARPNENTLVYPCGEVDSLARCLEKLCSERGLLKRMCDRSVELAWSQDKQVTVRAVVASLQR